VLKDAVTIHDHEKILPLSLIREHARIDDLSGIQDDLLKIYRDAAFETAETFTGVLWFGIYNIKQKMPTRSYQTTFINRPQKPIKLEYMPLEPYIRVGSSVVRNPTLSNLVNLDVHLDLTCCDPCGGRASEISYKAGKPCGFDYPPKLILGLLKYCAWCVEHPGDELTFLINAYGSPVGQGSRISKGTNNPLYASGAAEEWKPFIGYR
jgi:hypothetical protein